MFCRRSRVRGLAIAGLLGAVASVSGASDIAPVYVSDAARTFDFTYEVTVHDLHGDGSDAALWIPIPRTTPFQEVTNLRVESAGPHEFVEEEQYGNTFVYVDLSAASETARVRIDFRVHRQLAGAIGKGDANRVSGADDPAMYLNPSSLIRWEGPVGIEALRIGGPDEGNEFTQARRLYENIVSTVVYDKSGTGWGRGDSLYACETRAGNCTDFHSLFIGEARSLGIPARFVIGFGLPENESAGEIGGYHCWAEFYTEENGWLPIDASEAFLHPEKRAFLFGNLDPNRIEFTVGRDITLPRSALGPQNYLIYPHVEVEGRLHTSMETKFRFKSAE